jgi:hypothetical protein
MKKYVSLLLLVLVLGCKKQEMDTLSNISINGSEIISMDAYYSVILIDGATYTWEVGPDFAIVEGQGSWKVKIRPLKANANSTLCVLIKTLSEEKRVCKNISSGLLLNELQFTSTPRKSPAIFYFNNTILAGLGGNNTFNSYFDFSGEFSEIFSVNHSSGTNSLLTGGPQNLKRSSPVYLNFNNKFYVGFGTNENVDFYSDFWSYDPQSQTWSQLASNDSLKVEFAANFTIGTKAYVVTGRNNPSNSNGSKKNWEYDFQSNTWSPSVPFPGAARYGATGFSFGNEGYLLCGTDYVTNEFNDFWKFDPIAGSWTQLTNFPGNARDAAFGFLLGNDFYFGGGVDFSNNIQIDLWKCELPSLSWTQLPNLAIAFDHAAVCTSDSAAYIFGGRMFQNGNLSLNGKIYEISF